MAFGKERRARGRRVGAVMTSDGARGRPDKQRRWRVDDSHGLPIEMAPFTAAIQVLS